MHQVTERPGGEFDAGVAAAAEHQPQNFAGTVALPLVEQLERDLGDDLGLLSVTIGSSADHSASGVGRRL
ncbi:hypothetical protein ABTZ99_26640 [Actinosynnema sp. NPDC002837]